MQQIEWEDEPYYGLVLKSVKLNMSVLIFYISNKTDAKIIARFRHNRLGHNESMY